MTDEKFFETKYGLNLKDLNLPEEPVAPDYDDSILNLSNSILNYFGVKPFHSTLPVADEMLNRGKHEHVVVILLDGMGMEVLEKHLNYRDFLRRHLLCDYSSVFPPTTTASTTSFLSGKSPIEHGWLGWDVYFDKEDKTVTCFKNSLQGTFTPAAEYDVARKYLPYENIIDLINKQGKAKAYAVFPFGAEPHEELTDWVETIRKHCHKPEKNFVYAYWESPDNLLHRYGNKSTDVNKMMQELNAKMVYLCESCPETTFFITADHGHIDIRNEYLNEDYTKLSKMLLRRPSIEPRAISFYVKPEYMEEFPKEFVKEFGTDYILYTKEEALSKNIFGPGNPNENLTGIGDFVALAFTSRTILWDKKDPPFKSHHAGVNKKEMRIPLIWYENRPKHTGLVVFYSIVAMFVAFLIIAIL